MAFATAADAHELVGLRATGPHSGEVLIQPDPLTVRVTAGQPRRDVLHRNIALSGEGPGGQHTFESGQG